MNKYELLDNKSNNSIKGNTQGIGQMLSTKRNYNQTHKIFIVSAGRTGTKFLGQNLGRIIPSCYSVHEPDLFSLNSTGRWLHQFQNQGALRLILLKLLGLCGTRNVSLRRLSGEYNQAQSLYQLKMDRMWLFKGFSMKYYVESNAQLYGIVEDLIRIPNSRVVLIVRHPIPWVRSWMNRQDGWFSRKDLMSRFGVMGLKRLTPSAIGENFTHWNSCDRLKKLCWTWKFLHLRFFNTSLRKFPNLHLYRFEDLFEKRDQEVIADMVKFVTGNINGNCTKSSLLFRQLIKNNKVNSSYGDTLKWEYSDYEREAVKTYCYKVMLSLGYE